MHSRLSALVVLVALVALVVTGCGEATSDIDAGEADAVVLDASTDVRTPDVFMDTQDGEDAGLSDSGFPDAVALADAAALPDASALPDSAMMPDACAGADLCDGEDNDCDGTVDEDAPVRSCGEDEGVCMAGTRRCVAGVYGACEGQVGPSAEVCDGLDNDCNGRVDNGVADRSCGTDVGACRTGTRRCVDGEFASCMGQIRPSTEVDDLIDNDCDGTTDEGFPCMPTGRPRENFDALNAMRRGRGLDPMRCNRRLRYAAQKHAQWLCDSGATVPTHIGRGGSTEQERMAAEGVTFTGYAENVAVGFSTAQAVHNAWMASDAHRPPMITPRLTRVGIGYVNCGGRHWWVQDFAN